MMRKPGRKVEKLKRYTEFVATSILTSDYYLSSFCSRMNF